MILTKTQIIPQPKTSSKEKPKGPYMQFLEKIKEFIKQKQLGLSMLFVSLLLILILGYLNANFPAYFSGRYCGYRHGDYWQQNKTTPEKEVDKLLGVPKNATPEEREHNLQKVADNLIKQHKENPETSALRPIQKNKIN